MQIDDTADWYGTTGLDEETERAFPAYLRQELGEHLEAPDCLRASDLRYLGLRMARRGPTHFWALPERDGKQSFAYAFLDTGDDLVWFGRTDRSPPDDA